MRLKRLHVVGLAAFLLLLGLGAVWWKQAGEASSAPVGNAASSVRATEPPPPSEAPRDAAGGRAWVPGSLHRHALSLGLTVSFGQQKAPDAPTGPGMRFALQGEWDVGIVSAEGDTVLVRLQLRPTSFELQVEGQGALAPEQRQAMVAALSLPFFATLDRTGAVSLTHFEQGVDELARGLLRSVVASSQFVVNGVPGTTWSTEEQDTSGQYLAEYQRQGASRFEKRKRAYTAVATPQGLQPLGTSPRMSVSGGSTFELGEGAWLQTLQTREQLTVESGEGLPTVTNATELTLRLLERRQDASLRGAFAARSGLLTTAALASFQGQATDPLAHHRQVLGSRTFDDILADLRALPADEKARDDARTRALEQLRALLLLRPEEAARIPALLREKGLSPLAASAMLGALSAASTPESLRALASATVDTALTTDVRMDAVSALGMADNPIRAGVDTLRQVSRSEDPRLRGTATLAMGNAAMQLNDTDGRGSEALVQELKNDYRAARDADQRSLLLRALGNTRAPGALESIMDALRSDSVKVREAAMVALRGFPGPEADRLLMERLANDSASEVRRGAVFACGFRPLEPLLLPMLGQALREDVSDGVRSDIVQLLGQHRGTTPGALALLRWASQHERHPDIRRMATTYVETPTTPVTSQSAPTPMH
ncbi:HEAT repeat domain-containing protein [Myxococcus qinghaiensis]|uniref:HEAT repeat domain-containing protein n=1 Tax=Myxococcus qinghaiensis TaxID=2906758 RepID=UPI0020A82C2A|nr:HEAT repeat domain-containing protein [Myxococcus qinghaiensis]MCP3163570.1 HEAT repeat domain-containing protein [Myxococcus qinghaiensis]